MDSTCLAFSTALGDPRWFHEGIGPAHQFIDKRGVLNGLRAEPFVPRIDLPPERSCTGPKACPHREADLPWYCDFLLAYKEMLSKLDPQEIEQRFIKVGEAWKAHLNQDFEPTNILLVHEAPTNPCSERVMLQKWLKSVNMGGEEWDQFAFLEKI